MMKLFSPALSFSLFLVSHTSVIVGNTQRPAGPAVSPGSFPSRPAGDNNIRSRDFDMLEREARRLPAKSAQRNPLAPQLKEDFSRIQIISRDFIAANLSAESLNYKLIESNASEIQKRASRLRSHLMFAGAEQKSPSPKAPNKIEDIGVKGLMSLLDRTVVSFALNPIFKNLGVLDVQNSAKAKSDLDQIIKLSEQLRKEADKKLRKE